MKNQWVSTVAYTICYYHRIPRSKHRLLLRSQSTRPRGVHLRYSSSGQAKDERKQSDRWAAHTRPVYKPAGGASAPPRPPLRLPPNRFAFSPVSRAWEIQSRALCVPYWFQGPDLRTTPPDSSPDLLTLQDSSRSRSEICSRRFAGMAELVNLDRSGDWRRRLREREEVAVGFRGARPGRNAGPAPWAHWRGGNTNGLEPTNRSTYDRDQDIILKLEESGKVNPNELLTYQSPQAVLQQGEKIDPSNSNITSYINDMARGRRMLLNLALKRKSNTAEARQIHNQVFAQRPAAIQQIQGDVAELKGRYVRIPPLLVSDVSLLE